MRVGGDGPVDTGLMLVGEAPGEQEDRKGIPFCGISGRELDRMLEDHGLRRRQFYVTNLVKERPPDNADPEPWMVERDEGELRGELALVRPRIIGALGRFSASWLTGRPISMTTYNGIPLPGRPDLLPSTLIIPIFHPAAALRTAAFQSFSWWAVGRMAAIIKGDLTPTPPKRLKLRHKLVSRGPIPLPIDPSSPPSSKRIYLAIDTEGTQSTGFWGLSYSWRPGSSYVIRGQRTDLLLQLASFVRRSDVVVVLHNALHDLDVLGMAGINPKAFIDTMIWAFILRTEPQGLKPLSRRWHDLPMSSYSEVVRPARNRLTRSYLERILKEGECPECKGSGEVPHFGERSRKTTWKKCGECVGDGLVYPLPPHTLEWDKEGNPKVHQPQSVGRYIQRLLGKSDWPEEEDEESVDLEADEEETETTPTNLYHAWMKVAGEVRGVVEGPAYGFGVARDATLDDVEAEKAVAYSAMDADATIRLFRTLRPRVRDMDLTEISRIDHGIVPMIVRMHKVGVKVDREYFGRLAGEIEEVVEGIHREAVEHVGRWFNPDSGDQVAALLYGQYGLPTYKLTKGGRGKVDAKTLEGLKLQYVDRPEVVKAIDYITEYKEANKLLNTFVRPLPSFADSDDRIHTTYKLTRTETGRLACVAGDTVLPTSRGPIRIDCYDVREGDTITTHLGRQRRIIRKFYKGIDSMFRVCLTNGASVKCTRDHKLLTDGGWVRVGDLRVGMEVLSYECIKGVCRQEEERPLSAGDVLLRRQAQLGRYCGETGHNVSECSIYCGYPSTPCKVPDGEGSAVLSLQAGRTESYVGEVSRSTPELERRLRGSEGVPDSGRGWQEILCPQDRSCGNGGGTCEGFSQEPTCAPHRQEWIQQRPGQLSYRDSQGARGVGPHRVQIQQITYVGDMGVWDIEVEEDHSYLAHGFLHHNSAMPNMQQIPARSELGKKVRHGFVAREGMLLGSYDYDQIEMRVLAHESGDANLIRVFREGLDIHSMTASLVFRVPISQVTKDQRTSAKNIGFGVVYGITARGLKAQMDLRGQEWTVEECQDLIDRYLRVAYPDVGVYMDEKQAEARRTGMVRDMFGRIRYLPGVRSVSGKVREEALRQAGNMPIQSAAAGVLKIAMARLWEDVLPGVWGRGKKAECVLQVHDELVWEAEEDVVEELGEVVPRVMEEAVGWSVVPFSASGKWARDWGELK